MRLVGNMYAHFAGHATVPVWSLYLGYGALGLWILAFGIHVVQQWRDNEPRTTDYTSDRFFGIVWRWSYPGGTMSEPRAYCPSCDTTLVYSENREYGEWRTHFYCETCQKECHDAQGGRAYVIAKVVRQVDRKLRNGEWKPIVENARQSDTTTT
jgi:ribosomal protein S27E